MSCVKLNKFTSMRTCISFIVYEQWFAYCSIMIVNHSMFVHVPINLRSCCISILLQCAQTAYSHRSEMDASLCLSQLIEPISR